jgi:hypothetical protein
VTLAVTGNTISGQLFRRYRMPVSEWLRLPWVGSRWDIRWLSGRGKTPTLCDGEYYFRSGCLASEDASVLDASMAVDR